MESTILIIVLITILVSLAVLLAFVGVQRQLNWGQELRERLARYAGADTSAGSPVPLDHAWSKPLAQKANSVAMLGGIEKRLVAADSKLTATEFLMLRIGCAGILLLIGWLLSQFLIVGMLLGVLGWIIPAVWLARKGEKRRQAFSNQLPAMLNLIVGSLRAGYGLLHACQMVSEEMAEPVSTEFKRVIKEASLGYSLDSALYNLSERVKDEDLELVITAIQIQNEVGGGLADVLASISRTIRERVKLKGEIRTLTAQQRASGWILSMLPLGVGLALMIINPAYIMQVFASGWTLLIPVSALFMVLVGNVLMQRVARIQV